jgi:hypothetical protein
MLGAPILLQHRPGFLVPYTALRVIRRPHPQSICLAFDTASLIQDIMVLIQPTGQLLYDPADSSSM